MKKEIVKVSVDQEKLNATKHYMAKKKLHLEAAVEDYILKLYSKYVPASVREYIEVPDFGADIKRAQTGRHEADAVKQVGGQPNMQR